MKKKGLLFILLSLGIIFQSIQLLANTVYSLAPGEEFVYGKIGTFDDGSIKYTLAIVRKPNANKAFYYMAFRPYRPNIIQGSGNLKPQPNPKEAQKYDYWLIFNGKKFGPYDEIYAMNFEDLDVDKWVSRDGKSISFCGQKGNKFMGVVHNTERSMFWTPSQALTIDPTYNEDIFGLSYTKGDFRMYINGVQKQTQLMHFSGIKHANSGNMLYLGKDKATKEFGLYLNHNKITPTVKAVKDYGFINGSNKYYYLALLPSNKYRLVVGDNVFDFDEEHVVSKPDFSEGYLVFFDWNPENKKVFWYEYNLQTGKMNKHGAYGQTDYTVYHNKLAYHIFHQTKENGKFVHTHYFIDKGGELIEKYREKNTLDNAYMRISPKGDIYIIKDEGRTFSITKNGEPYPFYGNVYQIINKRFLPSTDELVLMSTVKSAQLGYNNDMRIQIGKDFTDFKGAYVNGSMQIADNAPVVYSVHAASGKDIRQKKLCKNGRDVLGQTWKLFDRVAINSTGAHYAVLACNYPEQWPANSPLGYHTSNGCVHLNWSLIVDGNVMDGNYGAPTYLKKEDKLVAIKQEGNSLVIKDLVSNQNYSEKPGRTYQLFNSTNTTSYVKIQNYWKNTFINIESGLTCGDIAPGWHSAMWIIEPSEDGHVKIKNRWKGTYLNVENGSLRCSEIQPGWHSSMWKIEPIEGTDLVRIKNRWKGTYLNVESGSLKCTDIEPGWHSARWYMK